MESGRTSCWLQRRRAICCEAGDLRYRQDTPRSRSLASGVAAAEAPGFIPGEAHLSPNSDRVRRWSAEPFVRKHRRRFAEAAQSVGVRPRFSLFRSHGQTSGSGPRHARSSQAAVVREGLGPQLRCPRGMIGDDAIERKKRKTRPDPKVGAKMLKCQEVSRYNARGASRL